MTLAHDLRLAVRLLVRRPLFTTLVVATIAIAIGLNSAVFAAVDALLLRPIPGVRAPEQVVGLYRTAPGISWGSNSVPHFMDVRERTTDVFEQVAAWTFSGFSHGDGDQPQILSGQLVSATYFSTLGVQPAHGRFFVPAEDSGRGAHPVVVLGDGTWRRRFGGDPSIVGRTIQLNGQAMEVIGVAPPVFRGTVPMLEPALFVPLMQMEVLDADRAGSLDNRGRNFLNVIARLRPGVTRDQAATRLEAVNSELATAWPEPYSNSGTRIIPLAEIGTHPSMRTAQLGISGALLGVVFVLLLLACVNVASLFLARARDRAREMAVRLAIGASRWHLVRQLMIESLLFVGVAGAAGLLVAAGGVAVVNAIQVPIGDLGVRPDISLSGRVLAFTMGVSLMAGLVVGMLPALQATRPSLVPGLKGELQSGRTRSRMRDALILAQVALSIILLTCAGLFVSNVQRATTVAVGFSPEGAVTATLSPALQGYDRQRAEQFYRSLLDRLRALNGVEHVGLVDVLPLGIGSSDTRVQIPGYTPAEGEGMNILHASVTPGYFRAMGIRLVSGREVTAQDDSASIPVVVVNERFVERFWPGQDPVGRTVRRGTRDFTVIGVVGTGKYRSLGEEPTAYMYFAHAQAWLSMMRVVVRHRGSDAAALASIGAEVRALDPLMPVTGLRTMTSHMGTSLLPARIAGGALGFFGAIGLLLAAIGIYGVMTQAVGQRTREIGIRMALGATEGKVTRLVFGQGMRFVGAGCVLGIVGAGGAFVLMRGILYGVGSLTVASFVLAPLVLVAVAAVATLLPVRRTVRGSALSAIRQD
ncbi:MAG: ABC transporter permease [Gemmatimonadetes bacterium]|nr:ABC transporter permease [Gemmatimonadota bacterium]